MHTSPAVLRPYPKAPPRKKQQANTRRKGETRILTDTPVRNQLAAASLTRKVAFRKIPVKRRLPISRPCTKQRRKYPEPGPESDSSYENPSSHSSDDYGSDSDSLEYEDAVSKAEVGDYVLVQFATKKTIRHYVGQVLKTYDRDEQSEVKFMRKQRGKAMTFTYPEQEDNALIDNDQIAMKLPPPQRKVGTKRVASCFTFCVSLDMYNFS